MKIGNIIKKALVERKLISEVEDGQQPSGQSTRSYDLNSPEDVINAAQQYECWKQWGLTKKPIDSITKKDFRISYRNQEKVIPKGTRFLYSEPFLFLGEKIQGETDKDNTYFYGFDKNNLSNNLFKGFRWTCKSLRNVDQAGTRNLTPAQQKLLDDFLATYGSVYTKVGGQGKVAKDITELKYKDGRTIWDENVGVPPKGNFVYVQETLYNKEPDQLLAAEDFLKKSGYTLEVPPLGDPRLGYGLKIINIFPQIKDKVGPDVMVYPITSTPSVTKTGTDKVDRQQCTTAIKYLSKCSRVLKGGDCDDVKVRIANINTAALCYMQLRKERTKAKNPTKMLGGIFGPEDELEKLVTLVNNPFGISKRLRELGSVNESKNIDSTIKKHLLESIRIKNSRI
jgi:hypothetical protein